MRSIAPCAVRLAKIHGSIVLNQLVVINAEVVQFAQCKDHTCGFLDSDVHWHRFAQNGQLMD